MIDLNKHAHSHDTLQIVQRDYKYCVCKTFRTDLVRAQQNVDKQRKFQSLHTGTVRVSSAEVLKFEVYSERAELLMPYVDGMTGHMFPIHATRSIAQTLSSSLSTLLHSELNESQEESVKTWIFIEKLEAVSAATRESQLKKIIDGCYALIENLPDQLLFPMGPCHGDLTLSNIILDPLSGITLIDFLQTFIETPLQDVAKLKQDFVYGWSFHKHSSSIGIKAEILCRYHYPSAITQIERMYPMQVKLLTLMALVRIAPYVKDDVTQQWLTKSLQKCMRNFRA